MLEQVFLGDGSPTIVFLHEGLGSVALWKDFPAQLCARLGARGLVYSRAGYGQSEPRTAPYTPRFMHEEARVLDDLVRDLGRYVVLGHSDGASIALIHAANAPRCAGVVVLAPHLFVEDVSIDSIGRARASYDALRPRLAKYHRDVDMAFYGWNDIWLDPTFRDWSIREEVARVKCPVLAIQGLDDEYGTMAQLDTLRQLAPQTHVVALERCGHSPQRDQPDAVIDEVVTWWPTT